MLLGKRFRSLVVNTNEDDVEVMKVIIYIMPPIPPIPPMPPMPPMPPGMPPAPPSAFSGISVMTHCRRKSGKFRELRKLSYLCGA